MGMGGGGGGDLGEELLNVLRREEVGTKSGPKV